MAHWIILDYKMAWHTIKYTSTDVSLHPMARQEKQYNYHSKTQPWPKMTATSNWHVD